MFRSIFFRILFFILFFTSFFFDLRAEQYEDIIEAIHKRTQQYLLTDYKKIVIFSPPRTGSTLAYNIFRFLFENLEVFQQPESLKFFSNQLVTKTHDLTRWGKKTIVFCTLRNPVDATISFYRVLEGKKPFFDEKYFDLLIDSYINYLVEIRDLIKNKNVVLLRYEEFEGNMEFIFQKAEESLGIQIDEWDKEIMKRIFSLENVNLHIKAFNGFEEYDPLTHYHGSHIDKGELTPKFREFLKKKALKRLKPYQGLLASLGYPLSSMKN